ncbi:MAG: hypothetical protein AAF494_10445 [Pseudomonadota bacterium]
MIIAILVGWNKLMALVGRETSLFLNIPTLTPAALNTLIITLTTMLPAAYVIVSRIEPNDRNSRVPNLLAKENLARTMLMASGAALFLLAFWYGFWGLVEVGEAADQARARMKVAGRYELLAGQTLAIPTAAFVLSLLWLKDYAKGVLFFVTGVVTIQIVYFLPFVGTWLSKFSDEILGAPTMTA